MVRPVTHLIFQQRDSPPLPAHGCIQCVSKARGRASASDELKMVNARIRTTLGLLAGGWMAVIFALSSQSHLPHPAGMPADFVSLVGHLGVYTVLSILLWGILPRGWPASRRLAVAFACTMAFALSDEWHQSFVARREMALTDLVIDAVGAMLALLAVRHVARATNAEL
jgi:VanZ family protein